MCAFQSTNNDSTIQITIDALTGNPLTLHISETDTIYDIKLKICQQWNYEPSNQKLMYYGKLLKDEEHPLSFSSPIKDGDKLNLFLKQPPKAKASAPIKITVKTLTQETLSLIVNPTDTTYHLKKKIENAWEHEPKDQMLLFAGKKLKDEEYLLRDLNPPLGNGMTVHLIALKPKQANKPKQVHQFRSCEPYSSGQIFVKTLTGKTTTLHVKSSDTIQNIKHKIYDKQGCTPEMQRLLFGGHNLCPFATLQQIGVKSEGTLHMVLKLGAGATPPDSLLQSVFIESFSWFNLHDLIPVINFDVNCTKLIWDYAPFLNINAMQIGLKCMASAGRSERIGGLCPFCDRYKYEKPVMDIEKIQQHLTANLVRDSNKRYDGFYGLMLKLQFETYRSMYNNTWTIQTNVDSINKQNIGRYIEIISQKNKTVIPFMLKDVGTVEDMQWVTIEIIGNSLKTKEMQKQFNNGKLEVNILVREEKIEAIYTGRLTDKGPIIGDVNLQHFIYSV